MKKLSAFIRKEFQHVFRDSRTLLILFILPVVQILLFGFALSNEVKNIGIAVLDQSRDVHSGKIIERISASNYFHVLTVNSMAEVETSFQKGDVKSVIVFPKGFASDLYYQRGGDLQVITDASDPNAARIISNYLSSIIASYQLEINPQAKLSYQIKPEVRQLYNQTQNGSLNFIPGVIALIFMIVSTALTSVSLVKEKEFGTMEILLVSPFKPVLVLIAKAIPYLVLSLINFIVILLLSVFLLDVEIKGSLLLIFAESTLFIVTCLSLGLLISNLTSSQQTAMLISMMGMMLPTMMLTGFMFPLESMLRVFQILSHLVPSKYYYDIIKAVMLKGLGFSAVWKETLILIVFSIVLLALAMKNFKTRLS